MKHAKKKVFIVALLINIILIAIAVLFDVELIKFIESTRNVSFDYLLLGITFASNTFIIFFFLTTLFLWQENKRRWIFPLWVSSFLSVAISYILKVLIKRPRPFHAEVVSVLQIVFHFMKDNFNTWNFSLPSFQAMLVFSAVPLLNKQFKKFRYVWFIFAFLVAFSRAYFGVHYVSDVLIGGLIGYLIGAIMVFAEERNEWGLKIMRKLKIGK